MAIHINNDFLDNLGLQNISEEQKKTLMLQILETLQLRVGTRITQEMTDEQLDEFEKLSPVETDAQEVAEQKQIQMTEWLKENYPHYEAVLAEELKKIKDDLSSSLSSVFDSNTGS